MPRRDDLESILIIGSGPIVIGQACEFDYSGAQACKALREEGYRVILVNSNPATIMTDPGMADATYIEPITWEAVTKIIEKEKPDAILLQFGDFCHPAGNDIILAHVVKIGFHVNLASTHGIGTYLECNTLVLQAIYLCCHLLCCIRMLELGEFFQ